jgi:hypothetical protein
MNTFAPAADPFFAVPRTVAATSEGPVELPILYSRTRNINALFLVERARVAAALADAGARGLAPACEWRGSTLVALCCFEYHDTSIGAYKEIGLAVAVVPAGVRPGVGHWLRLLSGADDPAREVGFYVLHLPVTTATACAVGREIWGLPKFVTPIHYGRAGNTVEIGLADPFHPDDRGRAILELSGKLGAWLPSPALSPLLYSQLQGRWLRTAVNVRGRGHLHGGGGVRLHLGTSPHPMAGTLSSLGLSGARPLFIVDTDRLQSRLNAGRPVR